MARKKKDIEHTKRLVLLDAHAILHRAYHALPDFTSHTGEPTGGLYGFVTMVLKIADELKPDYIVACFDLPEPTHRHIAFEAYKAQRKKADDALVAQMIRSRDLCEAFSIPVYEKAGFEADDVLGTIVEDLKEQKDIETVIASGDMDTLQLVDGKKVQVYTLKKGIKDTILYDEKGVVERFGFGPSLIPDYKGLRGDPSDNIPGIAGIGEKSATELITNFGSLEDIYATLAAHAKRFEKAGIKKRIVELLKEGEEEARFSKELATIRRDAPINFSLPEHTWRESIQVERVTKLFGELGFRSLMPRIRQFFGEAVQEPIAQELPLTSEEKIEEKIESNSFNETAVALWLLHSDTTSPTKEDILEYAKTDSFGEARAKIMRELEGESVAKVFHEIEQPLITVVDQMEAYGVLIDVVYLKKLSEEYHVHLTKIEERIWGHVGEEFNINSPKQLGEILFNKLNLTAKGMKKTAGGAQSTRESELEKLKGMHPIIDDILEYREFQKLLSTYIDNIPNMVGSDGRLHTRFLQAGTTTGRGCFQRVEAYANDDSDDPDDCADAAEQAIVDALQSFAHWIGCTIAAEWEYQFSDECVDDSIRANEYEFTENGEPY
jgi:DNA polymerase-1